VKIFNWCLHITVALVSSLVKHLGHTVQNCYDVRHVQFVHGSEMQRHLWSSKQKVIAQLVHGVMVNACAMARKKALKL